MTTIKIKLLFVVEAMGGGVFTYIYNLANELSYKYEVYIAYGVRNQTPTNYKKFFNQNIHLIEITNFTRKISPTADIKSAVELNKLAQYVNPDIIHLHSSKAGAIGRLLFFHKKYQLFYTPHGYSYLIQGNILKKGIYKVIEYLLAKVKCTTISCSIGEHQETLKLTKNAKFVNNGISIEELNGLLKKPRDFKNVSSKQTVFTLGRITKQKNPRLFNQIAESLPDVQFVWIGDGELRYLLSAENIEIKGWLGRDDALKIASQADTFLLPSLWEGLPISLLEAMYLSKKCVVSNVVGNKDVINNGKNGYICDTLFEYVDAIHTSNNNVNIQAHNDILDKSTTHIMSEKYAQIYSESIKMCS
ncbi:glycosyltransferase [Leuconostoc mesenteroides]|uniref:glycosyltransferase n=1 Tax=Leuconostoc mesenteroides TaxID=1245 RepID=UPI001CBC3D44|nr:glycosyltransferase [Leuconostoc mesenteroides]